MDCEYHFFIESWLNTIDITYNNKLDQLIDFAVCIILQFQILFCTALAWVNSMWLFFRPNINNPW